MNLESTGLW